MSSPGKSLSLDSYWHFLFFLLKTNRTGSRNRRKSADGDYRLADPQGADGHQAGLRGRCVSRTVFASWASLSFLALWVGPVRGSRRRAVGEGQVNEGGNEQAIPWFRLVSSFSKGEAVFSRARPSFSVCEKLLRTVEFTLKWDSWPP